MRFRSFVSAIQFLFIFITGCVYEAKDVYFYPINPSDIPKASVDLNNVTDSITISDVTKFTFSFSPSTPRAHHYKVTANSNVILSFDSEMTTLQFTLDPAQYSNPVTLIIQVTYHSGSGSLADQLDTEIVNLTKTWTIFTDLVPPSPIPAPLVYIQDGKSIVQWSTPDKQNFSQLVVVRTYDEVGLNIIYDSLFVTDKTSTTFHDDSYVGGKVIYHIVLKGYKFKIAGPSTTFDTTPFQLTFDSLATPRTLRWTKPTLYGNSLMFAVTSPSPSYPPIQVLPGSDGGSYSIGQNAEPLFGGASPYQISLNPINTKFSHGYTIRKTIYNGTKIPKFQAIQYVASLHAYFLLYDNALTKIDDQNFSTRGTLAFDTPQNYPGVAAFIPISANGQFAYLQKSSDANILVQVDLSTMSVLRSVNLKSYTSFPYFAPEFMRVSNDNLLYFESNGSEYIVDMTLNQIVWTPPAGERQHYLSPDGGFLATTGTVYKRNSGNWNTVFGTFSTPTYGTFQFRQGVQNELILVADYIYVYDLDSPPDGTGALRLLASADVPPLRYILYDPFSNTLSGIPFLVDEIRVYDLTTFQEIMRLPIAGIDDPLGARYINGRFFHKLGYTTIQ